MSEGLGHRFGASKHDKTGMTKPCGGHACAVETREATYVKRSFFGPLGPGQV